MKKETGLTIVSSLLIMLFLYASISKLAHPSLLVSDMHNQPFPSWFANFLVVVVPTMEILVALALIFDTTRLIGLWASAGVMSLFTLYTALILLHFFPRVPCGCGGVIRRLSWPQHLLFNLLFLAISLTGILILQKKRFLNH